MPELPEVQTIVAELRAAGIVGRRISGCDVFWRPLVAGCSVPAFKKRIVGQRIQSVARRGKYIVIGLSGRLFLLVHLRMSGHFSIAAAGRPRDKHEHLVLRLDDRRELRYRDTRKFGRWQLTAAPEKVLGALGPEPLSQAFTPAWLHALCCAHKRMLKPFLLDQKNIAGLGNIYADEALWAARLHPGRATSTLSLGESAALCQAIRCVLRRGIRNKGTSLGRGAGNYMRLEEKRGRNQDCLRLSRRRDAACPRCGRRVRRTVYGQRATYFCRVCQGAGPSAKRRTQVRRAAG